MQATKPFGKIGLILLVAYHPRQIQKKVFCASKVLYYFIDPYFLKVEI